MINKSTTKRVNRDSRTGASNWSRLVVITLPVPTTTTRPATLQILVSCIIYDLVSDNFLPMRLAPKLYCARWLVIQSNVLIAVSSEGRRGGGGDWLDGALLGIVKVDSN